MALTSHQLAQFDRDGFLLVRDLFTPAELRPAMAEIAGKVERLARALHAAGRLDDLHADEGFYQRLTSIERDCPGAATVLHTNGVLEPALAALWSHPRLLDIMEQLLGPEVAGHPVWNLRCKTPLNPLATVPWHQDTAYLAPGSEATFQATAWIPFLDAGSREGTLQFIRGGHRHGVRTHRLERDGGASRSWYLEIPGEHLPPGEVVTAEVPFGSVLLLNQLTPHRSTENLSERIRWSIDLRWQRPDEPTGMDVIAPPVVMRSARPGHVIDWSQYLNVGRNRNLDGFNVSDPAHVHELSGPWTKRWSRRGEAVGA
jgi:hypothetical protein